MVLCGGGFVNLVRARDLNIEKDYWNQESCTEVLNLSRLYQIRQTYRDYFEAGADVVVTNMFGAALLTLSELNLKARTHENSKLAAEVAREAADSFSASGLHLVVGSVGPGTQRPSLGNIDHDSLEAAMAMQSCRLIAGGWTPS